MSAADHGQADTYQIYGCRCVPCVEANAKYTGAQASTNRALRAATREVKA